MALAAVSLDDKYALDSGRVFLTGTQALVRLPMMQRQRDRAAGLDTAAYVTGYRGSPLGALDQQMERARRFLDANDIVFRAGVNEDLAATAVWGTQQLQLYPQSAKKDGIFALWYGKGPGVDRCSDVFKHANMAGTSRHGAQHGTSIDPEVSKLVWPVQRAAGLICDGSNRLVTVVDVKQPLLCLGFQPRHCPAPPAVLRARAADHDTRRRYEPVDHHGYRGHVARSCWDGPPALAGITV